MIVDICNFHQELELIISRLDVIFKLIWVFLNYFKILKNYEICSFFSKNVSNNFFFGINAWKLNNWLIIIIICIIIVNHNEVSNLYNCYVILISLTKVWKCNTSYNNKM